MGKLSLSRALLFVIPLIVPGEGLPGAALMLGGSRGLCVFCREGSGGRRSRKSTGFPFGVMKGCGRDVPPQVTSGGEVPEP